MNTGEISIEINNIKKNSDRCEKHQKDENNRIQDQINKQVSKFETTKKGIYEKIVCMEDETEAKINKAVIDLKGIIKDDLITPFNKAKKTGIKIIISTVAGAFSILIGFIYWLLTVSNVINNLESLIGG
jgi:high-affinity K+ transport system ATPase subunit B